MCGFAGWFDVGPATGPQPDERARRAALDALAARGPDGEGVQIGAGFGLLHRRLAIVDLANGAQPMAGPRPTQWLAWNGEMFDYAQQRRRAEADGERLSTRSDTDLLARLVAARGVRVLEHLRAQFAIAWIDGRFAAARPGPQRREAALLAARPRPHPLRVDTRRAPRARSVPARDRSRGALALPLVGFRPRAADDLRRRLEAARRRVDPRPPRRPGRDGTPRAARASRCH